VFYTYAIIGLSLLLRQVRAEMGSASLPTAAEAARPRAGAAVDQAAAAAAKSSALYAPRTAEALYGATQAGDLAKMGKLLDGGAEPDAFVAARDHDGTVVQSTALIKAAESGQLAAVRLLLGRGADPNLAESIAERGTLLALNGGTPLMNAAASGHVGVVRELAARGADLDAANNGWTAFHLACGGNQPECAAVLVELGCDTAITGMTGMAGKQIAEERGHAAVLERVAEAMEQRERMERRERARPHSGNYTRQVDASWTSSMAAATKWMEGGWRNSATVLTAAVLATTGSAIIAANITAWLGLALAFARSLARSLCSCGACLGCRRWLARTRQRRALYGATQARDLATMGQLLDGGAEPDAFVAVRGHDGTIFQDTALGAAAGAGDLQMQPQYPSAADRSAGDLQIAGLCTSRSISRSQRSQSQCLEAVRLLLDRGADPSLANSLGHTALMGAAASGHVGVVRELATRGVDLDAAHLGGGWTAFHLACGGNQPECAAVLVELGCDTAITGKAGTTGEQIAKTMGRLRRGHSVICLPILVYMENPHKRNK
jgi:ankyrin repeat protein